MAAKPKLSTPPFAANTPPIATGPKVVASGSLILPPYAGDPPQIRPLSPPRRTWSSPPTSFMVWWVILRFLPIPDVKSPPPYVQKTSKAHICSYRCIDGSCSPCGPLLLSGRPRRPGAGAARVAGGCSAPGGGVPARRPGAILDRVRTGGLEGRRADASRRFLFADA